MTGFGRTIGFVIFSSDVGRLFTSDFVEGEGVVFTLPICLESKMHEEKRRNVHLVGVMLESKCTYLISFCFVDQLYH